MTPYICKRGGTLTIHIKALTGLVADVTGTPVAKMKAFKKGGHPVMPGAEVPIAATLAVTTVGQGWDLTLTGTVSANLDTGAYLLDFAYITDGQKYVDGPVLVEVQNSAATTP